MFLPFLYLFYEIKNSYRKIKSRYTIYCISKKFSCSLSLDLKITGDTCNVCIGPGARINSHSEIRNMGNSRITIGSNVYCGGYLILLAHTYIIEDNKRSNNMVSAAITIEDDAWIGSRVFIMPGVIIGKGAVIGAGSVVTSNVPAYQRYAGVPARPI